MVFMCVTSTNDNYVHSLHEHKQNQNNRKTRMLTFSFFGFYSGGFRPSPFRVVTFQPRLSSLSFFFFAFFFSSFDEDSPSVWDFVSGCLVCIAVGFSGYIYILKSSSQVTTEVYVVLRFLLLLHGNEREKSTSSGFCCLVFSALHLR